MSELYVVDRLWMRSTHGLGVLAGTPPSYFRVTPEGARVLDALESGGDLAPDHRPLTDRLLAAGAIHPVAGEPADPTAVTVVIPVCARSVTDATRAADLVAALDPLRVVVVDDASPVPLADHVSHDQRVLVVRLDDNVGPGAARNAGLSSTSSDVVVFVDDDVEISVESVRRLAGLVLVGPCVVAAPRIIGATGGSALADYEHAHSPLDMGDAPSIVRVGRRVPYVPSAVLACSTGVLRSFGGFDASMRTGEDVDLVWRLSERGQVCRYAPTIDARHLPRPTMRAFAGQRFSYGASAARLDSRHPWSVAPFRGHPIAALPAVLLLLGLPMLAAPAALVGATWVALTLRSVALGFLDTWKMAGLVMGSALRLIARAVRREWWPLFAVAAVFSNRAMFALVASIVVPAAFGLVKCPRRYVLSRFVLRLLDDAAYGIGVWFGAVRQRSFRCVVPRFSVRRSDAR